MPALASMGIYTEVDWTCAVTGEPAFAFYGRTAHVCGRLSPPVGVASWHMYIIDNTLSRT